MTREDNMNRIKQAMNAAGFVGVQQPWFSVLAHLGKATDGVVADAADRLERAGGHIQTVRDMVGRFAVGEFGAPAPQKTAPAAAPAPVADEPTAADAAGAGDTGTDTDDIAAQLRTARKGKGRR